MPFRLLFAILLIVIFAGGSVFNWFPLRGLSSENSQQMSWPAWILDYFWHLVLPLTAMGISSFATITFLTKNSFLDEIRKQYVMTARAKGLTERRVLYGHVFRNAMLLVIAGFPAAFIGAFFSGSILIENIFHLDGLGLLSFESLIKRDYAVVFATLYVYSCIGLLLNLLSDLTILGSIPGSTSKRGRSKRWMQKQTAPPGHLSPPLRMRDPRPGILVQAFPYRPRRLQAFKANKRGYYSLIIFAVLFVVTLFAEFIANDKPLLVKYDGALYMPIFKMYTDKQFGGEFETEADYRDPAIQQFIHEKGGWTVWPLIPYGNRTVKMNSPGGFPEHRPGRIGSAPTTNAAT